MLLVPKKKAIIMVSFGTVDAVARHSIDSLTKLVQQEFIDYTVRTAFTSTFILEKLKKLDITVFSLTEQLVWLRLQKYQEVIIQPTHLSQGVEYQEKIVAVAERYRSDFTRLIIGPPAIVPGYNDELIMQALLAQCKTVAMGEEVVFMGHGSLIFPQPVYQALQDYIDKFCSYLTIGLLEDGAKPNFTIVLQRLRLKKRHSVYLMPLLFVAGMHVLTDMAGTGENSWYYRLQQAGFAVRLYDKGLGENVLFQKIYLRHIQQVTENS